MKRLLPLLVLVLMLVPPADGGDSGVQAAPRKTKRVSCRAELAETQRQLVEARAEAEDFTRLLERERERVERLEKAIGPTIIMEGDGF